MGIIIFSNEPAAIVPGLMYFGFKSADPAVRALYLKETPATHLFKFQFNFWWIVVPAAVIAVTWQRIAKALARK